MQMNREDGPVRDSKHFTDARMTFLEQRVSKVLVNGETLGTLYQKDFLRHADTLTLTAVGEEGSEVLVILEIKDSRPDTVTVLQASSARYNKVISAISDLLNRDGIHLLNVPHEKQ